MGSIKSKHMESCRPVTEKTEPPSYNESVSYKQQIISNLKSFEVNRRNKIEAELKDTIRKLMEYTLKETKDTGKTKYEISLVAWNNSTSDLHEGKKQFAMSEEFVQWIKDDPSKFQRAISESLECMVINEKYDEKKTCSVPWSRFQFTLIVN